jgi:hypothetical protein
MVRMVSAALARKKAAGKVVADDIAAERDCREQRAVTAGRSGKDRCTGAVQLRFRPIGQIGRCRRMMPAAGTLKS